MKLGSIILLIIILGAGYWYLNTPNNNQIKQTILDTINKVSQEMSNRNTQISCYGITPNETLTKCLYQIHSLISSNQDVKNIISIGYLNTSESLQPLFKINVENRDINSINIEDIRTPKFKIENDLWLYDFLPYSIALNNNFAIISLEYDGNMSDFKYDLANTAFNIYEDVPEIENIEFNFIGNVNFSVNLSRSDIFDFEENNSNSCAPDKESAYKEYVNAYNEVIDAQQKGDNNEISKAYQIYQKARACYESFSRGNTSYNSDEY